jgi:hypothetical protein
MKIKNNALFFFIIFFFLLSLFFTYKEGLERSEWITPGYDNKDRYYNEHKKSGNPEIDAIKFNHRSKKPEYKDAEGSTITPVTNTYYQLDPLPLTLPKPSEPVKKLTPEEWKAGLLTQEVDNPVTPQKYRVSVSQQHNKPVISNNNNVNSTKLVRKRRKKV